ncbi:ABC-2 type transport system permease protein [Crossiella equi]|uniref:ABC-2 type transport system permease protein n=1 Tax=Crossiella equi TaxID=130796 RepID=A0ABS5ADU6_9PSEU|nr:ABC-2 family transporter protein [Crossiella equi]MBP2474761.1 ABC-2 type transport system permease protein [Crossiella equi]
MAETSTATVYRRLVHAQLRSQLAYRGSFALTVAASMLGQLTELVAILAIFSRVQALAGFSREEVLLMYALAGIAFGLADLVVGQVDELPRYLRTGRFDALLVRPLSSLGQLVASDFQLRRVGRSLTSAGVLVHVLSTVDIDWRWDTVLLLVLTPVAGAVIYGAVWVLAVSACFWLIEGAELVNSVTHGGNFLASYPIGVYPRWLRAGLAFVVPSAFVAYYPALGLLDRPDPLGGPAFLHWCAPPVAALLTAVTCVVWRTAVRHYRGSGS